MFSCKIFLVIILTAVSSPKIFAQALSVDDIKAQMVKDWERAKAYTDEYLNTMPADKFTFKAVPVDSVRNFAQQMIHLAQGNYFLMSKATGDAPPAFANSNLEHSASAQTKDSVTYYVNASYDFCINAVKNSDLSKWGEKVKIFGMETTRYAMMIKTFEHQTHHRGQTTIYIRVAGIKPPQEKLF
ncbi:MAG: DinB family protein [Bacteroidetes bacterium]|nr:DinB family protein [Bacteroidota bacterium]MBS1932770.1 DinB family protein [Bacteroidota bacterium]